MRPVTPTISASGRRRAPPRRPVPLAVGEQRRQHHDRERRGRRRRIHSRAIARVRAGGRRSAQREQRHHADEDQRWRRRSAPHATQRSAQRLGHRAGGCSTAADRGLIRARAGRPPCRAHRRGETPMAGISGARHQRGGRDDPARQRVRAVRHLARDVAAAAEGLERRAEPCRARPATPGMAWQLPHWYCASSSRPRSASPAAPRRCSRRTAADAREQGDRGGPANGGEGKCEAAAGAGPASMSRGGQPWSNRSGTCRRSRCPGDPPEHRR